MVNLLTVRGLCGGYGQVKVLHGVDLGVAEGGITALVGRNGMGKTTTIRMITGALAPTAGVIEFAGRSIVGQPPHVIAQAGVGLVPEGRRIFPSLTVREHLLVAAAKGAAAAWPYRRIVELFPRLEQRAANFGNQLSGGEQQMLAIGRALSTNPRLLILDEATEGLAPLVRAEIWLALRAIAGSGVSVIVIDKNIRALARIADQFVVMTKGQTVWSGNATEFFEAKDVQRQHMGL